MDAAESRSTNVSRSEGGMMSEEAIKEIGSEQSLEEQQKAILAEWGADVLLEDHTKKTVDMEKLEQEAEKQTKTGAKALLNKEDIELKTELLPIEILAISRLLFIAERHNISGLDRFTKRLLELKVSQYRKGRSEFIQGLHAEERRQVGGDLSPLAAALTKIGL
jgi:hypothetical protein